MKPIVTWILIANGARARLFSNDGPGHGVRLVSDEVLVCVNLPGREIMSDRPGRTFDSVGAGRHAKEPRTDAREIEKRSFAHELAAMLDDPIIRSFELHHSMFGKLRVPSPDHRSLPPKFSAAKFM